MVIRGHIKNGNGTNKYLTGSRDVRKKRLSNLFEYHIRFTIVEAKKKKKAFYSLVVFSPNYPQYGNLH